MDSDSVICFGCARLIDDISERAKALNAFERVFRPDAPPISEERLANCAAVEITIREMTGRRERARQRTLWRYVF